MCNEQSKWPRILHIAHCTLRILAQGSTPAGSWSQSAVNKPWRLSMNRPFVVPALAGRCRPKPGIQAKADIGPGARSVPGRSGRARTRASGFSWGLPAGHRLRPVTGRAPVHDADSRPASGVSLSPRNLSMVSPSKSGILPLMDQAYRIGRRIAGWGVFSLFLLSVALADALADAADSLNWRKEKGLVDADISSWSLVRTLENISEATGWQVYLEPGTQRKVSTKFKERPRDKALDLLLGNLGRVLLPGTNSGPSRFLVFRNAEKDATRSIRSPDKKGPKPIPNELIVTLKPGKSADELAKKIGAKIVGHSTGLNSVRFQFEDEETTKNERD